MIQSISDKFITDKFPTTDEYRYFDTDIITNDIIECMTKYTFQIKGIDTQMKLNENLDKREYDILYKYIYICINETTEKIVIPPKDEEEYNKFKRSFANDFAFEFDICGGNKRSLERHLFYICTKIHDLLLDPKGVIFGSMRPCHRTILHEVAGHNQCLDQQNCDECSLMLLLLDHGSDVNAKDYLGLTPFRITAQNLSLTSMKEILKTGAVNDEDIQNSIFDLTEYGSIGNKDIEIVEACFETLKEFGGRLDNIDRFGNTLVNSFLSNSGERLEFVQLLIRMSDSNWYSKNKFGVTPMHSYVRFHIDDNIDILEYFCKSFSFDVNEQDNNLRSPLIYSVINDLEKCCDVLLKDGANVNLQDRHGLASLHYAAVSNQDCSITNLLLDNKADIHIADNFGDNPLVHAAATNAWRNFKNYYQFYEPINYALLQRINLVAEFNESFDVIEEVSGINIDKSVTKSKFNVSNRNYHDWLEKQIAEASSQEYKNNKKNSILQRFYNLEVMRREENRNIKDDVTELLNRVSRIVRSKDRELAFIPVLSGSNAEGTKAGVLDELDFMCELEFLSTNLGVSLIESESSPGFVKLKVDHVDAMGYESLCEEMDGETFVSANHISERLFDEISLAMSSTEVWNGLHIIWNNDIYSDVGLISTFQFIWNGKNYKQRKISVDLVPTIVLQKEMVPSANLEVLRMYFDLGDVLQRTLVIVKQVGRPYEERQDILWRTSFSPIEATIFQMLPENIRTGYKLVKFIRQTRICPLVALPEKWIPSYLLKTCLLHEIAGEIVKGNASGLGSYTDVTWGSKILDRLEMFLKSRGSVPNFFNENVELSNLYGESNLAYCSIGKAWLKHPWDYLFRD